MALVHLDIKPDNILLGTDQLFKLGDFGHCCSLEQGLREAVEEGDSRYMAPELLQNEFGKAADVFRYCQQHY